MPLIVQSHAVSEQTPSYFARVVADQPQAQQTLATTDDNVLLVEAIFNGQPVALLLAHKQANGCCVDLLIVHPATRGRGVGRELARKSVELLPAPVEWSPALRKLVND